MLTMSPAVKKPPAAASPVTASPVLTPIRTASSTPRSRSQLVAEHGDLSRIVGRRAHRAQRIVLVGDRDAEDRHHGVADVVLDRAAVALDDIAHADEPALHRPAQRLGIHALSERRRSDDVGEDDGDDLAALAGDTRRRHRRPTGRAEPGSLRRPLATPRARLHGASLESPGADRRDGL